MTGFPESDYRGPRKQCAVRVEGTGNPVPSRGGRGQRGKIGERMELAERKNGRKRDRGSRNAPFRIPERGW